MGLIYVDGTIYNAYSLSNGIGGISHRTFRNINKGSVTGLLERGRPRCTKDVFSKRAI